MTNEELIAKLEAATGPDLAIDLEIARLQGVTVMRWDHELRANVEHTYHKYTESMDSARSLVPEGSYGFAFPWFYSQYSRYEKPCVFWRAAIHKPIWEKATPTLSGDDWFERAQSDTDSPNPAIALCIAALKARLSVFEESK